MTQPDQPGSNAISAARESYDRGDRSSAESPLAVTVLGMHRSGTSAMARILSLLGADLPRKLMDPRADNPAGYWEPQRIVELNDELLASAASSWDDVSPFPPDWYGSAPEAGFRERAIRLLDEEYRGSRLFVLKDPRMCRIVPFWVAALDEFGATPTFVITVRNPLEVAASLKERDEFSIPKGLLLWLRHALDAERETRGHPRVFVSYEQLLDDWEGRARAIADHLQISWPRLNHDARDEVDRFIATHHRHQRFSPGDVEEHTAVVEWVKRCYAALADASRTGDTPLVEVLSEIAEQVRRADRAYGPLLATARGIAAQREEELEAAREEADRLSGEIEERAARGGAVRRELEARRARAGLAQQELLRREDEIGAQREEIRRLTRELARGKPGGRESEAKARRDRAQAEALGTQLEERDRRLAGRERELAVRASELERLSETAAGRESELQRALADRERDLDERRTALANAQTELEQLRAGARESERRLAEQRSETERLVAERERLGAEHERRLAEQRAEIERLGADAADRQTRAEGLRAEVSALESELAERNRAAERLEGEVASRTTKIEALAGQLDEMSASLERLGAEAESLRGQFAAVRDETARIYLAARPRARVRTAIKLLGWTVRPTRWRQARDFRVIRRSDRFDPTFYLVRYPDAAAIRGHPALHYVERGASEGKDPSSEFSTAGYLADHPELAESGENAFAHFLRAGRRGTRSDAGPAE